MNDTQYTSVLVPYSLGNSKQPGFCPKKPFTKATKIHKTFWTFCLLSEQCAACRRRQLAALQTMEMLLDGAKYDWLLNLQTLVPREVITICQNKGAEEYGKAKWIALILS